MRKQDYKTRKEYRWAKKTARKQHAKDTRGVRYLIVIPAVIVGFVAHSFLAGLVTLVVVGVLVLVVKSRRGAPVVALLAASALVGTNHAQAATTAHRTAHHCTKHHKCVHHATKHKHGGRIVTIVSLPPTEEPKPPTPMPSPSSPAAAPAVAVASPAIPVPAEPEETIESVEPDTETPAEAACLDGGGAWEEAEGDVALCIT